MLLNTSAPPLIFEQRQKSSTSNAELVTAYKMLLCVSPARSPVQNLSGLTMVGLRCSFLFSKPLANQRGACDRW